MPPSKLPANIKNPCQFDYDGIIDLIGGPHELALALKQHFGIPTKPNTAHMWKFRGKIAEPFLPMVIVCLLRNRPETTVGDLLKNIPLPKSSTARRVGTNVTRSVPATQDSDEDMFALS